MTKLYLHVGPHKTGTSSIQEWLATNRSVLRLLNYEYPGVSLNHNRVANAQRLGGRELDKFSLAKTIDELSNLPESTSVILSAEAFDRYNKLNASRLIASLEQFDVIVIYYIRKTWDRAASSVTQKVKTLRRFGSIRQTVERRVAIGELGNIYKWAKSGCAEFKLRVYDHEQFVNGDLIDDFLDAVGLPSKAKEPRYLPSRSTNEMPGLNTLRVLYGLKRRVNGLDVDQRREIRNFVTNFSVSRGWNEQRATLISSEDVARYRKKLENSYSTIARRYLNRSDGLLFRYNETAQPSNADSLSTSKIPLADAQALLNAVIDNAQTSTTCGRYGGAPISAWSGHVVNSSPRPASVIINAALDILVETVRNKRKIAD